MTVIKGASLVLGFCVSVNAIAVRAQGISEMGAVYGHSAGLANTMANPTNSAGLTRAYGSALNSISGAGTQGGVSTKPLGINSDGEYDASLAAKQAVAYSNKLYLQAQQKQKAGKLTEAEQLYRQAVMYRERVWGTSDPSVVKIYEIVGDLSRKRNALSETERVYRIVLIAKINRFGAGSYELCPILTKLGQVYLDEKKYKDAVNSYEQIYQLRERKLGAQDPQTIAAALTFANACLQQPETVGDAADNMRMYSDMLDKGGNSTDPNLLKVLDTYEIALRKQNKPEQADKVQARAAEIKKAIEAAKQAPEQKPDNVTTSGAAKDAAVKSDSTKKDDSSASTASTETKAKDTSTP